MDGQSEQHYLQGNGPEPLNGHPQQPTNAGFEPRGKILAFDIILDRHDGPNGVGVFSPGEVLSGHVRLELSQRMTVNNVDLLVQGTGNAAWQQRTLQGDEMISDDEVYLNEIAGLVGKRQNEMVTLSAGEHIFPFACDLPWELPATFTGSHGNVSYLVKVVLQADRNEPSHREPCVATNIFLIESRLSLQGLGNQLNSYRIDYKHPVKTSALSTGSSAVKVSLFMPRRAYDIGDTIVVNLSLTNSSRKAVQRMSLALVMEAVYKVRNRNISERMLVTDHEDAFVVRHLESRQWRHVGLAVPRFIPPTQLPHSNLIFVRYWLVFKAELERTQDCVMLQTPVLVGLELPDEMKVDTVDGSLAAGGEATTSGAAMAAGPYSSADELASAGRSTVAPQVVYQGKEEPRVDYRGVAPAGPSSPVIAQPPVGRPLYVDVKQQQQPQIQQQSRQQPKKKQQQPHQQQPVMPEAHYQPFQQPQRLQPPHSFGGGGNASPPDSQVITMRFADELDDAHSPYGQPRHVTDPEPSPYDEYQHNQQHSSHAKVSRNPLYTGGEDEASASVGVTGGASNGDHRMSAALEANLNNGGDSEEVLY